MELIPSQQTRKLSLKEINLCVQIGLEGYKKRKDIKLGGKGREYIKDRKVREYNQTYCMKSLKN